MGLLAVKYRKFIHAMMSASQLPLALNRLPTYEAFSGQCPICERWSTFNRISDLQTLTLINPMKIRCQFPDCGSDFIIKGDLANPAWQMLILDCEELKHQKRYMYCILNLAQAFEMYFALYFRVQLLYKPFALEKLHDIEHLNRCHTSLFESTKKSAFYGLRNMFINSILQSHSCSTLSQSDLEIGKLISMKNDPGDTAISTYSDHSMALLLRELRQFNIGELRNDVVHKYAYRPRIEEVEKAVDETARILYAFDHRFGILADDANHYFATS